MKIFQSFVLCSNWKTEAVCCIYLFWPIWGEQGKALLYISKGVDNRWLETLHLSTTLSNYLLYPLSPVQDRGEVGVYLSCLWVRGSAQPGRVSSPSQGWRTLVHAVQTVYTVWNLSEFRVVRHQKPSQIIAQSTNKSAHFLFMLKKVLFHVKNDLTGHLKDLNCNFLPLSSNLSLFCHMHHCSEVIFIIFIIFYQILVFFQYET